MTEVSGHHVHYILYNTKGDNTIIKPCFKTNVYSDTAREREREICTWAIRIPVTIAI